jgi:hypothetical protein
VGEWKRYLENEKGVEEWRREKVEEVKQDDGKMKTEVEVEKEIELLMRILRSGKRA